MQKKLAPPNDLLERNSNEKETSTRTITSSGEKKLQQGQIQQPTSSSAIDQALEEERLQEIRKINSDLVLVNEMFRSVYLYCDKKYKSLMKCLGIWRSLSGHRTLL